MRSREPPIEPPPHPLLPWERVSGGETTSSEEDSQNTVRRMFASEAENPTPAQPDVLGTSGESVVAPPVAKVRRIEPTTTAPSRTYGLSDQVDGYGPPPPPDENSDGDPAAHLRT
eukprot:4604002-Amphidinium_carterae.1